jgi:3-mercaptopyruvate sulfurtransferase SseA
LRAEFLDLIGDRDPRTVVHMCGSGVTACVNVLAMEIAGCRARSFTRARGANGAAIPPGPS